MGTKRIDIEESVWMPDWFVGYSPRSEGRPEGFWCQWVHVAREILADERTKEHMPEFYLPYEGEHVYSGHHPACSAARDPDEEFVHVDDPVPEEDVTGG